MIKNEKLKLSELADEVEVSVWYSSTPYTVAELKREILELKEPHHENKQWCVIGRKKWIPSAESMMDRYIESSEDEMYEDWNEAAKDCVKEHHIEKLQAILDEAFAGGMDYWEYGKDVEIDIRPPVLEAL